ncbi:MAG: hypothetical protein FRX48_03682 [Lasallia pustulata]|uniref:Glycine zipper 2TM domain-containing protein n=1 Tax=Lasallia pustulata TaxID=136370 RepID=A0A5M8PSX8_9LECA|nr:MAG: hypothetical protein FRX48_03682 [Lasallia pustulata]
MAVPFVALGLRAAKFATEKYHDRIYDKISPPKDRSSQDTLGDSDSDTDSAAYSDDGTAHHRHKQRGRGRRGTSDGLEERKYPDPWSGYAPDYAPRAEYDASGTSRQASWPQPSYQISPYVPPSYQPSSYVPPSYEPSSYVPPDPRQYQPTYTPPSSLSPEPRPSHSHRRRSYSLSSAPRRSRQKSKSSDATDMTSGVIGALAGGLVGSQVSSAHAIPAVVGAAIGAVGLNRLEKRQRGKEKKKERAGRS